MNLGPFDQPLWLVALLAIPPLLVVTSYRVGWLATLLVFLWADSSMLFAEEPRQPRVRVAVLGLLLLQGLLRLRGRGRAEMPPRPALLLFALAAISLLWTETRKYSAANVVWLGMLGLATFGQLARLGTTPKQVERTAQAAVTLLLLVILVGFVPWLRADTWTLSGRLRGFFNNPNGLGITCALAAPWIVLRALERPGPRQVAWGAVVGALGLLALLSGSRTGLGGLVVGVATTLFLRSPSRSLAAGALLGVAISLASLAGTEVDLEEGAVGTLARTQTLSRLSGRLERWEHGLERWRQAPVLGAGFKASWQYEAADVRDDTSMEVTASGTNFHSQLVETMVDLGAVGALLLLALLWTLGSRARKLGRRRDRPEIAGPGAAFAGTFTAAALDSLFHNWILTPGSPYALVLWSLVALCCRLDRLAAGGAPAPPVPVPAQPIGAST